ncbi:MAG: hypothetical protein QGG09_02700, partial [Pirellulaceae bacterium]|nr:hypothetical protein [Pirellulaceae bacterium]
MSTRFLTGYRLWADSLTASTDGLLFLQRTGTVIPRARGDLRSAWCCGRETASQQVTRCENTANQQL